MRRIGERHGLRNIRGIRWSNQEPVSTPSIEIVGQVTLEPRLSGGVDERKIAPWTQADAQREERVRHCNSEQGHCEHPPQPRQIRLTQSTEAKVPQERRTHGSHETTTLDDSRRSTN